MALSPTTFAPQRRTEVRDALTGARLPLRPADTSTIDRRVVRPQSEWGVNHAKQTAKSKRQSYHSYADARAARAMADMQTLFATVMQMYGG